MIDKLQQLQRALGGLRVAQQAPPAPSAKATPAAADPARSGPERESGRARLPLADQIRRRVAAIAADDPQRRRRMLRIVLELCLAAEWGDAAAADPAFHALVDQVQGAIEADASLQAVVDDALNSVSSQT
jgi:hypothetical protein